MPIAINILIVEDDPNDAELHLVELRRAGFDPQWKRVETEQDFLDELKNSPDLILSDFSMPQFNGLRAADLLQASGLDIPFILISGTVGEDVAVKAMKHGATDYLLKDRITRLGSAVERALRESQTNKARKQAEQARHEAARLAQSTIDALSAHLCVLDEHGTIIEVNAAWNRFACENHFIGSNHGVGDNYLKVCDSVSGNFSEGAAVVASGIRAVMAGQSAEFRLEYTCHSPREQRWFALRATRFAGDGTTRVVVVHENITERKRAEGELEKTHRELLEASRQAGMAEFATSVLHNVGNVLNSVNVASICLSDSLKKSKSGSLLKVVALMRQHEADMGDFFTNDPRGKQLPAYLAQLADHLASEQTTALDELGELQKNIEHIKNIITVQQDSTKLSRLPEMIKLSDLIEDALKMNANGLTRAGIQVRNEFEEVPPFFTERHTVLQILVNLVRNAIQACEESEDTKKFLAIRVSQGSGCVRIAVADNGSGILAENLPRIFVRGFTTKKDGHGFGLHSAALSAKEMGGSLAVQSEGLGRGAKFTLEIPMKISNES